MKKNLLKDVYSIVYDNDYGTVSTRFEAWSESDAIAMLVATDKVYCIVAIKRVA